MGVVLLQDSPHPCSLYYFNMSLFVGQVVLVAFHGIMAPPLYMLVFLLHEVRNTLTQKSTSQKSRVVVVSVRVLIVAELKVEGELDDAADQEQ